MHKAAYATAMHVHVIYDPLNMLGAGSRFACWAVKAECDVMHQEGNGPTRPAAPRVLIGNFHLIKVGPEWKLPVSTLGALGFVGPFPYRRMMSHAALTPQQASLDPFSKNQLSIH